MHDLLFEIGVEELPALSIEPAQTFCAAFLAEELARLRLSYKTIDTYGTPRRLVVVITDLVAKQEDVREEVLGPNVAIAFNAHGELSAAGLGFLKSKGLAVNDIIRKATDKGEVIAAQRHVVGSATKDLLPSLLVEMMRKIPFKKRMRWESSNETFARPVRWLLCLYGEDYVPVSFADVTSGQESTGHRFMNPEMITITSVSHYLSEMKARHVILSSQEREAIFIADANKKLGKHNAQFTNDPELMATVRNLVECPYAIVGSFESSYLAIPAEILVSEMKTHQKSFAVYDADKKLLPYFVSSAGTMPFDEEIFAQGNARVLRARFEDGAFYFAEDRKKSLHDHAQALSGLIFERELGTMQEKAQRIEAIATCLATHFNLSHDEHRIIKQAAPLLKADLCTGVVGQFPELQGVMGRTYAIHEGIDNHVATCIETHYWPRFADDQLPPQRTAVMLSIADKLDTLVGIIAIGKGPQGNKDPFALRRSAIAIVRMLVHFGLSISTRTLVEFSLKAYQDRFNKAQHEAIINEADDFIRKRARGMLIDDLTKESKEYAVNFADSVMAVASEDMLDVFARAHTLLAMRNLNQDEFASLVGAIKRASNLVKKAEQQNITITQTMSNDAFTEAAEIDLLFALKNTDADRYTLIDRTRGFLALRTSYEEIFSQIARIKPKLDKFFDSVMVMVDEPQVRNARLFLLSHIKSTADRIADFTHL